MEQSLILRRWRKNESPFTSDVTADSFKVKGATYESEY